MANGWRFRRKRSYMVNVGGSASSAGGMVRGWHAVGVPGLVAGD